MFTESVDFRGVELNITSKTRYAIKIMLDLTSHYDAPRVQREEIVRRQGVPKNYLDQLMVRLRKAGLVVSLRGRSGGYRLSRSPRDISMWDVMLAVEVSLSPVVCLDAASGCAQKGHCNSEGVWRRVYTSMVAPLKSLDMAGLLADTEMPTAIEGSSGLVACRPGHRATVHAETIVSGAHQFVVNHRG